MGEKAAGAPESVHGAAERNRPIIPLSKEATVRLMALHPPDYRSDVFSISDNPSMSIPLGDYEAVRMSRSVPFVGRKRLLVEGVPRYKSVEEFQRKELKRLGNITYVDYGGSSQPLASVVRDAGVILRKRVLGNTHSESPSARLSSDLAKQTRDRIREFFSTAHVSHEVIFTSGTSAALRLLADSYFNAIQHEGLKGRLLLTDDCHNAVNGMRTIISEKGLEEMVTLHYVPVDICTLRVDEARLNAVIRSLQPSERGLIVLTAQSNVSGVKHPFERILTLAKRHGWDTALDAAAYIPTTPLNLSNHSEIDFLPCSWYKVLGYPTGIGSLIVRQDAMSKLRKAHFSGGTVDYVHNGKIDQFHLHEGHSRFEDGSLNFQAFVPLDLGLQRILSLGPVFREELNSYVGGLSAWLARHLPHIRWPNTGHPVIRVVGFPSYIQHMVHGSTLSLVFYNEHGAKIPLDTIEREAAKRQIHLRSGCMCNYVARLANPGDDGFPQDVGPDAISLVDWAFEIGSQSWILREKNPEGPFDETGVVRVSLGMGSRVEDVRTVWLFVRHISEGKISIKR